MKCVVDSFKASFSITECYISMQLSLVQRFFFTQWYWYWYPFKNGENGVKIKQTGIFYQCTCNVKLISKEEKSEQDKMH